jgi:hypothetical protein
MTNDFDELASAYIDGLATDEEVARVEASPDLRARVEALRAVARLLATEPVVAESSMRTRHLASALDAFDQLAAETSTVSDGNVIDLTERQSPRAKDAAARAARVLGQGPAEGGQVSGRAHRSGRGGISRWLSAAAAVIVVGGGVAFVASSMQNPSEDTSMAPAGDASEPAGDGRQSEKSLAQGDATSTEKSPSPAAGASASAAADSSEAASTEADGTATPAPSTTTASSRLAPAAIFSTVPSEAELIAALEPVALSDSAQARCANQIFESSPGATLLGYATVTVAGEDAEAFVFAVPSSGQRTILVVDRDCKRLA